MAPCRPVRLVTVAMVAAAAAAAFAACGAVIVDSTPHGDAFSAGGHPAAAALTVGRRGYVYNPWLAAIRPHLPSVRLAAAAAARQDADADTDGEDNDGAGSGRGATSAATSAPSTPPASPPGLTCQTLAEVEEDVVEAAASIRADDEAPPGAAEEFSSTVLAAYPSFVVDVVGDRSCVKTGAFGDFLIDTLVAVLDDSDGDDDDDDEQH